jgi:hypothetical protein
MEKHGLTKGSPPENFIITFDLKLEILSEINPTRTSKKQNNGLSKNQNNNPSRTNTFTGKSLFKLITPDRSSSKDDNSIPSIFRIAITTLQKI